MIVYMVYGSPHDTAEGLWHEFDDAVEWAEDHLREKMQDDEVVMQLEAWDHGMGEIWEGRKCWRVLAEVPIQGVMVVLGQMYVVEMVVQ